MDRVVRTIAAETIRNTATTFETLDFFTNRTGIRDTLSTVLSSKLSGSPGVSLTLLNLLSVDVPTRFENAVIQKTIVQQSVITLQALRQSQLIQSRLAVVNANAAANITVVRAQASATGYLITTLKGN
jgi:hypothetical protein